MPHVEPVTDLHTELERISEMIQTITPLCDWKNEAPNMPAIDARRLYEQLLGRALVIEVKLGGLP